MQDYYTITVEYKYRYSHNPDKSNVPGVQTLNVQFPRAQDYRYYLYWPVTAAGGDPKIALVGEAQMQELPADPAKNIKDPLPSTANGQTLVVVNMTQNQKIDQVLFEYGSAFEYSHVIEGLEPKNQERILLGSGSYKTTISAGGKELTGSKNTVITAETGGMSSKTNYLYFYQTKAGYYDQSSVWPPLADDAADDYMPDIPWQEGQGVLEIINAAVPTVSHSLISKIRISSSDSSASYGGGELGPNFMGPGEPPKKWYLPAGSYNIQFMPTDQSGYGVISPRVIQEKKVTTLVYTNAMGDVAPLPTDGDGLIRIVNKSSGMVIQVEVDNLSPNSVAIDYNRFVPPVPVSAGGVGLATVPATASGAFRDVGIALIHGGKALVVQKNAFLKEGYTAEIVITDDDLASASEKAASRVVVENRTSQAGNALIVGLRIYPAAGGLDERHYSLPFVAPNNDWSCYVVDSLQLPIVPGSSYKAELTVSRGNYQFTVDHEFDLETLYSENPNAITRTITLLDEYLPLETFIPIDSMTIDPQPYRLRSNIEEDGNGKYQIKVPGGAGIVNLNSIVMILPGDATNRDYVEWTVASGGASSYVSLTDSVLEVTGIAPGNNNIVTVNASIRADAPVTEIYNKSFTIKLVYYLNGEEVEIDETGTVVGKGEWVPDGPGTGTGEPVDPPEDGTGTVDVGTEFLPNGTGTGDGQPGNP
jgi:hypothetical protein